MIDVADRHPQAEANGAPKDAGVRAHVDEVAAVVAIQLFPAEGVAHVTGVLLGQDGGGL